MKSIGYQDEISFKKEIKYLLYTPKDYSDVGCFPLLIFLHGAGERGDDLKLVKKHGPPKLICTRKWSECFIHISHYFLLWIHSRKLRLR